MRNFFPNEGRNIIEPTPFVINTLHLYKFIYSEMSLDNQSLYKIMVVLLRFCLLRLIDLIALTARDFSFSWLVTAARATVARPHTSHNSFWRSLKIFLFDLKLSFELITHNITRLYQGKLSFSPGNSYIIALILCKAYADTVTEVEAQWISQCFSSSYNRKVFHLIALLIYWLLFLFIQGCKS